MDMLLWYITRGSAVAALIALTVTVALGIYSSAGTARGRLASRFRVHRGLLLQLHRSATLAGILATAVHVASMVISPHGGIGAMDILVPFQAPRTWAYGLGTLAVDLMLVAAVTGWLRHRISLTVWRGLHASAYLMWPLAVFHAVASGTDATSSWFPAVLGACGFLVAGALTLRLWPNRRTLRHVLAPRVHTEQPGAQAGAQTSAQTGALPAHMPRYDVAPKQLFDQEMAGQR